MLENEIRRQVGKSPEEMMRDYIDSDIEDEENYIYTGKVINNNDPEKQGKCQIKVYSIFDQVPDIDLPWALPDFTFIGSKVGNFIVPPVGAIVNVYFDKGDIYLPHYTTKSVSKNSLPTQRLKNYPENMVMFETDDGDYLTIDRKSKETTFNHNSGTKVLFKKDGSIEITANKDIKIESNGTMDLNHTGNLTVAGSNVIPAGKGPLCALPNCLFTGALHTGNICLP